MDLRYGLNPDQAATASLDSGPSPVRVLSGEPSYINLLDALGAWQLVRELAATLGEPAATSFKHVSPAGAALAGHLDQVMTDLWVPEGLAVSPIASAYIRARDCDPKSSFGDFIAVSEPVDTSLARVLKTVVSDGIIAPGFEEGSLASLAAKKGGRYLVLEAQPDFTPPEWETRDVFGVQLRQQRPTSKITTAAVTQGTDQPMPDPVLRDLVLAMVTARYTQSNSITLAKDAFVLGVGAGQQSRVDCTKIACAKADTWWFRRNSRVVELPFLATTRRQERLNWQIRYIEGDLTAHERARFRSVLSAEPNQLDRTERDSWLSGLAGVSLASDGYIPFRDNIDHAARHGVQYIADPGGSARSDEVLDACAEHNIVLSATGIRLFHH